PPRSTLSSSSAASDVYKRQYVHRAVIDAGENITGVTIHLVEEEYDTGKIIRQCEIEVLEGDTIDSLSKRVLERENAFYVETLKLISEGVIKL
ncbi:formyltransferase family protein, partial [Methanosarcina sp. 2.H.T.1A.15]|uniref:formyltransferase family protein n=1 Tax=Methanosarcina sp. 2.H.T.1A.15 TaxID=1483596 RepID=UPI00064E2B56